MKIKFAHYVYSVPSLFFDITYMCVPRGILTEVYAKMFAIFDFLNLLL